MKRLLERVFGTAAVASYVAAGLCCAAMVWLVWNLADGFSDRAREEGLLLGALKTEPYAVLECGELGRYQAMDDLYEDRGQRTWAFTDWGDGFEKRAPVDRCVVTICLDPVRMRKEREHEGNR